MPLINNDEEFHLWLEQLNQKSYYQCNLFYDFPRQYPCWLLAKYDVLSHSFRIGLVYQTEAGAWDLQRYEDEER